MIQVMRLSENPAVVQLFSNLMTKTGNLTISEEDMQGKQTKWTSALAVKPQQAKKFNTKSRGKYSQSRQMQTIAATMRNSLLELLQKVSEGSAHFVRCLRSNLKSTPFSFDRDLIRYQIRALGIVETIRARQLGYPRRLKFAEFLRRYKFLAFDFDENVDETRDNCRLLLIRLKLEGWTLGKSRVLLKHYNEEFLSRYVILTQKGTTYFN
ncbi:Neither inactivation nor afterpotential protein C [Orchesella cincta]|uniref:Neither inactivation nor afterpotential protein C n=1 Tax=Orchesella cincta TaxID=48709 RepID=A0A1D2MHS2_ORCCI|nr:Neither inactivation nor afterpotential protein C [Orchesella cincta]